MDSTMTKDLVIRALEQAWNEKNLLPAWFIIQTVAVSIPAMLTRLMVKYGMIGSMSRKGNCYDNACAESFFSTLKNELVYLSKFKTRKEARQVIFEYIEVFYNRIRPHSRIGYISPVDYEKRLLIEMAA